MRLPSCFISTHDGGREVSSLENSSMSPSILRIRSDDKLPERADAVVIGCGIVGVSTACSLAKRGLSVAILEDGSKATVGAIQKTEIQGICHA